MTARKSEQTCLDYIKASIQRMDFPCMKQDQIQEIKTALRTACPSPATSKFPDFICEDGFIEHFEITSALEGKHGSKLHLKQDKYKQQKEQSLQNFAQDLAQYPPQVGMQLHIHRDQLEYNQGSYEQFQFSVQKHLRHHIDSLHKYDGPKRIGIFLLDFQGGHLSIQKNVRVTEWYRPSLDRWLLNYFKHYRSDLKYILYTDRTNVSEAICLKELDQLIAAAPAGLPWRAGGYTQQNITLGITGDPSDLTSGQPIKPIRDESMKDQWKEIFDPEKVMEKIRKYQLGNC